MKNILFFVVVVLAAFALEAGLDGDRIAAKCKVTDRNTLQGFPRTVFEFEGCEAWVVEPEKPAAGAPWVWCMEWPTAFQDRTGVKALLEAGYRWVTFNPASGGRTRVVAGNQNDEMVARRNRFQKFLVAELGLEPKCGLIGMSWGGFYSVRYASTYPECVKAMFLDAPLLDFSTLAKFKENGWKQLQAYYPQITSDYVGADDPLQPVAARRADRQGGHSRVDHLRRRRYGCAGRVELPPLRGGLREGRRAPKALAGQPARAPSARDGAWGGPGVRELLQRRQVRLCESQGCAADLTWLGKTIYYTAT